MKMTTNFFKQECVVVELDEHDLARIVLESVKKEFNAVGMASEIEFQDDEDCKTVCTCRFTRLVVDPK